MNNRTIWWKYLKKQSIPLLMPALLAIGLQLFVSDASRVEALYSTGLYVYLSRFFRLDTGWIPFSIGDLFYGLLFVYLLLRCIQLPIQTIIYKKGWGVWRVAIYKVIQKLLWVYCVFMIGWGMNYYRAGITYQLNLTIEPETKTDLTELIQYLVPELNKTRLLLSKDSILPEMDFATIKKETIAAYNNAMDNLPYLRYKNPSIKQPLFNPLGDYIGYTGYFNPFSGEAHIRQDIPTIEQPFIMCHEVAHQLGYASETEANFVGFLACRRSKNIYFRYSLLIDMYSYTRSKILFGVFTQSKDSNHFKMGIDSFKNITQSMDTLVRMDLKRIRAFYNKRQNDIAPVMGAVYNQYLLANNQDRGTQSYEDVVNYFIAYRKKYKTLLPDL